MRQAAIGCFPYSVPLTLSCSYSISVLSPSVRDEREGTEQLLVFFVPADRLGGAPLELLHEHGKLYAPLRLLVAAVG